MPCITLAGKPLDPYIEKLESDMTVTYFMLPVPSNQSAASSDKQDKDKKRQEAAGPKTGQPIKKFQRALKRIAEGKRRETPFLSLSKVCIREHLRENPFVSATIWGHASWVQSAQDSMSALSRDATRHIPRRSTNDNLRNMLRFHHAGQSANSRLL